MQEATPQAENMVPPAMNKRTVNNSKGPAQATFHEVEYLPDILDKSPPKKKKSHHKPMSLESADLFEDTVADAKMEVSMLFTKFAEVLSEKATIDTSQMKELEGILREARNLECYLKEKKKHLRQTLAVISDKLQC